MSERGLFILAICTAVQVFWALSALAQVDTAWLRRYNGPANMNDGAYGIAVDVSRNIYAIGTSFRDGTHDDYAIVKYLSNGDTAWVRTYSGPGEARDSAWAVALNQVGDVYVTGLSYAAETSYDYATVKYDRAGNEIWARRYNGPGNDRDKACAAVVDASGNVYVTGESLGDQTLYDFATVKYDSSGNEVWVRRHNGPGNDQDKARAIAVDSSGNVCVTGRSVGDGTLYDFATVKYDGEGNQLWIRRYNGPANRDDKATAIATDGQGNVYVAGSADHDFAVIKYYPNGDTAWIRSYNGPADYYDWPRAIAVDSYANVYVTGYSYGIATATDIATLKYDGDGNLVWVQRYDGPDSRSEQPHALVLDSYGNAYVTGASLSGWQHYDYVTLKYDPAGTQLWVRTYNGPAGYRDRSHALALDDSGNVYVTGYSSSDETGFDFVTIKYFQFLRGDADGDGAVDAEDIVYLIHYLYINGPPPVPILMVADVDCDGLVHLGDVVYLINYVLKGGPPPDCP